MDKKKMKRLLILNIPYFIVGLFATNLGEAWRLAEGADFSAKLLGFFATFSVALSNPLPSFHPSDLLVGIACGAAMRLAVYLRGKNAKKYRHNVEYGSARWGTAKDIEPFMAPKFEDNIILTKTERLMMSKNAFNQLGVKKLPTRKELSVEFNQLLAEKKQAYAKYRQVKKEMQEYQIAKRAMDIILNKDRQQEEEKQKRKER